MLSKNGHSDYYTFTQPIFNNNIESNTVYEAHLPKQEEDVADNKKPYKNLRLAFGAKLLFSSGSIKVKDYQFVIGYKAGFFINDNKMDYSNSCLSTDSKNNQKFNLFYLFQTKVNYVLVFWLHNTQCIIININKYFQDLKMAPVRPANVIFKNGKQ